jgi:hypothetical protein
MTTNSWKLYPHKTSFVDKTYYYPFFFYPNYYYQSVYKGNHAMLYDPPVYSDEGGVRVVENFSNNYNKIYYSRLFIFIIILSFFIIFTK